MLCKSIGAFERALNPKEIGFLERETEINYKMLFRITISYWIAVFNTRIASNELASFGRHELWAVRAWRNQIENRGSTQFISPVSCIVLARHKKKRNLIQKDRILYFWKRITTERLQCNFLDFNKVKSSATAYSLGEESPIGVQTFFSPTLRKTMIEPNLRSEHWTPSRQFFFECDRTKHDQTELLMPLVLNATLSHNSL